MKWSFIFFLTFIVLLAGCSGSDEKQPPKPSKEKLSGETATGEQPEKRTIEGEEKEPSKTDKEIEQQPADAASAAEAFKQKVIDNYKSYWADAQEGDWVIYVTHLKQMALFRVIEVKEKNGEKLVRIRKQWFYPDGKETPPAKGDEPEPEPIDVNKDKEDGIRSISSPHVTVMEAQFIVPTTKEKLDCILNDAKGLEDKHAQSLYSSKVRCGGIVYTRISPPATTYIVLWDYGDKNKDWRNSIAPGIEKASAHLMQWDRFYDEKFEGEEDPPEGEPPEPPED